MSNEGKFQHLQSQERRWRFGFSLLAPAAITLAPKVAALGIPLCTFRRLTDLPCPLCGGTRICAALAQGDFSASMQLNSGLLPILALAILHSLILFTEAIVGRKLIDTPSLIRAWKLAGAFLLLSWLTRLLGEYLFD